MTLKKQNIVTISRGSNFIAMKLDLASTQDNILLFFNILHIHKGTNKNIFFSCLDIHQCVSNLFFQIKFKIQFCFSLQLQRKVPRGLDKTKLHGGKKYNNGLN